MDKLKELLDKYINEGLKKIVISNARRKDGASKLQVRPILVKGELVYQITRTEGQKELHERAASAPRVYGSLGVLFGALAVIVLF